MQSFLNITKALSDEKRLRVLMALEGRELCACQIIELLEIAPSTVSRHMALLRQAGVVTGRKKGRWMYYRLPDAQAPEQIRSALLWVRKALASTDRIRQDADRLKEILKSDPSELCWRRSRSQSQGAGA